MLQGSCIGPYRLVRLLGNGGMGVVYEAVQESISRRLPDGTPYLVMQLLKGQSLAVRLRQEGKLTPIAALQAAWQVADALRAAHKKGIVHRDLKPDNIFLVPESIAPGGERVELLDFGIARIAAREPGQTDGSVIMGTPRYMSPEAPVTSTARLLHLLRQSRRPMVPLTLLRAGRALTVRVTQGWLDMAIIYTRAPE